MYEDYDDEDEEDMPDYNAIQIQKGKVIDIQANTSSKDSSNNKNSSGAVTSISSKPLKPIRTVVIDYGEHHRMSMKE